MTASRTRANMAGSTPAGSGRSVSARSTAPSGSRPSVTMRPEAFVVLRAGPDVDGHAPAAGLLGFGDPVEVGVEELPQGVRAAVRDRFGDQGAFVVVAVGGDRLDDRLLAAEVAVDRAGAHARFGDDLVHGRAVRAGLLEARHRRVEDPLPLSGPALLTDAGHTASSRSRSGTPANRRRPRTSTRPCRSRNRGRRGTDEHTRFPRVEPAFAQSAGEVVALEVDGHVGDPASAEHRAFPGLCRGMVDLEHRGGGEREQAVRPRVVSGAEEHALAPDSRSSASASSMTWVRAAADARGPGPATTS